MKIEKGLRIMPVVIWLLLSSVLCGCMSATQTQETEIATTVTAETTDAGQIVETADREPDVMYLEIDMVLISLSHEEQELLTAIFHESQREEVDIFPESIAYYRLSFGEDSYSFDGYDYETACARIDGKLYILTISQQEAETIRSIIERYLPAESLGE